MATTPPPSRTGIPPPPPYHVARERLTAALEEAVTTYPLVLVTAPAGYGKTTALASWARETGLPVAWLSVEAADRDPIRFLRGLLSAWARIEPAIHEQPVGILLEDMAPAVEAATEAMIDAIARRDEPLVLIIDDAHLADTPDVGEVLTTIVDHLPPHGHVVIGSRDRPSLPIARYRARQLMDELGPETLRFRADETAALLRDSTQTELSPTTIAALDEHVEGWAAGLQLLAVTIRHGRSSLDLPISGRHPFIADFLRDEVLSALPEAMRTFLIATSIVPQVNAALAEALTGTSDAQQVLEELERRHLFTQPLDDERSWYRYHRLFADALRSLLERRPAGERRELHRRAAQWYLDQGDADPALDHAIAARDLALGYRVLDRYGLVKLHTGQFRDLRAWLDAVPDEWYAEKPDLVLLRVALLLYTGKFEAGVRLLGEVEQAMASAGEVDPVSMGRATAVRCFIACSANEVDQAERFAESALRTLPESDDDFRASIWGALGDVYRRNGRWQEAHASYLHALPYSTRPVGQVMSIHVYGGLADLKLRQGHLRRAASYWLRARGLFEDNLRMGEFPLPVVGWVYTRHGEILYEWNQLEDARDAGERGRRRAELGGDPRSLIASGLLVARLHLAHGDLDAAGAMLDRVHIEAADAPFPEWRAELERCQVEHWLAQGKVRTAVAWAEAALARDPMTLPDQEPVTLAIARVQILIGAPASIDLALRLTGHLADRAEQEGRIGLRIAALAQQALALAARGDTAGALAALEPALRLAEPEGYVRSFVDLGLPMARLLQVARQRRIMPDHIASLIGAFDAAMLTHLPEVTTLPEPLTEREHEVLELLAAGLTNREIAERLYISAETVKKHTGNIYSKLAVRNRAEAIARSRDLDLLT